VGSNGQYIADEGTYKEDAYLALTSRFVSRDDFEQFYLSLNDSAMKDDFLRAATFYLFFVKRGDWHVSVERSNPVIDYITNSFKIVGLFSLIESLSCKEYKDFYQWLRTEAGNYVFPIHNQEALSQLNDRYKDEYGSIRRCKAFFENLPRVNQEALCQAIKSNGEPLTSIAEVANLLYMARSEFVHAAEWMLLVGSGIYFSKKGSKKFHADLSMDVLLKSVEEGIIAHFDRKNRVIGPIKTVPDKNP